MNQIILNKNKGIATTKLTNKSYEEEFTTNPTNPIQTQDIWYDLDLIPDVAPGISVGVVKYFSNETMSFVGSSIANSTSFTFIDSITGENHLKSIMYGVNGINNTYKPIVRYLGNIISETLYYIDVGSGILTFYQMPKDVSPTNLPTISFYKYVGIKGIPRDPIVVEPNNLTNTEVIYKHNIIITNPQVFVFYYSIANSARDKYRSGYLSICCNDRVATFTDTLIENSPSTSVFQFKPIVINSYLYIGVEIVSDIWDVSLKQSELVNPSNGSNANLLNPNLAIPNTVSDMGDDTASVSYLLRTYDSSLTNPITLTDNVGILIYYVISEVNSNKNVRAGKLFYSFTSNNITTNVISREEIFPLIGDNSLSVSNNFTFLYTRIGGTNPSDSTNFNIFLNVPITTKKYKITTYENKYSNANQIISNLGSGLNIFNNIVRNSTNYINYHYILKDTTTITNVPSPAGPITTFGELSVIWDNLNSPQLYNVFLNSPNPGSELVGTSAEISPPSNILSNITFSANVKASDPTQIEINISLSSSITTTAPGGPRTYTLYLFKQSPFPIQLAPLNIPLIDEVSNIFSTTSPLTETKVLYTFDKFNTNGVIVIYTIQNTKGNVRRTGEIKYIFNGLDKPPIGNVVQNERLLIPDIGDLSFVNVYIRYTNINPELVIDVSKDTYSITYQIIDLVKNYSIKKTILPTATVTCDIVNLSDKGCKYYYLIRTTDTNNVQLGDLFSSFGETTITPVYDPNVSIININYASDIITYPLSLPIGSIGNTDNVNFTLNYTAPSTFVSLNVSNNVSPINIIEVFLYKMNINSNIIGTNLANVKSIDYSPLNIPTTNSISTGKNIQINNLSSISAINDTIYNIFTFNKSDTIIPPFSTIPNVDRNPEEICTYIIDYVLFSTSPTINSFRTGELYLQWLNNNLTVNDRYTSDVVNRTPADLSINEVSFSGSVINDGNKDNYNLNLVVAPSAVNTYSIRLFTNLALSNVINQITTNQVIVPGPLVIGGNTVVAQFNPLEFNGLKILYTLTTTGISPSRKRIGSLYVLWDNATSTVIINDNHNLPTTSFEINDTSGVTFLATYTNNIINILVNVISPPYPQFYNISYQFSNL